MHGSAAVDDLNDCTDDAAVQNRTWPVTSALLAYPDLDVTDREAVEAAVVASGAAAGCCKLAGDVLRDARAIALAAEAAVIADLAAMWQARTTDRAGSSRRPPRSRDQPQAGSAVAAARGRAAYCGPVARCLRRASAEHVIKALAVPHLVVTDYAVTLGISPDTAPGACRLACEAGCCRHRGSWLPRFGQGPNWTPLVPGLQAERRGGARSTCPLGG